MKHVDFKQKSLLFPRIRLSLSPNCIHFGIQNGIHGEFMSYLVERSGRFYYNRRVPKIFKSYDRRSFVRVALNTDSRKAALRLAVRHNEQVEAYWQTLIAEGETHAEKAYKALVDRARLLGFAYCDAVTLSTHSLANVLQRAQTVEEEDYDREVTSAILGAKPAPCIRLDQVLEKFWPLAQDQVLNKSPNQLRKWKNPRIKALRNFSQVVGSTKSILELTRDDTLKFRQWWVEKIQAEDLRLVSGNKDMIHVKTIIGTVADKYGLPVDIDKLFKKLLFKKEECTPRLPFTREHLLNSLLKPENLAGLNEQAKYALLAFSETGAGFAELTGLLKEDIRLDADIPHIQIKFRKGREIKTRFRNRVIPLVGFALDAFKACPNGFPDYHDNPDSLSGAVNKFLRENNLLPSDQHSVYSLRHSFQDRLLAANAPDRVQADLMGHKFNREAYGNGATLEQKMEYLQKIQLKPV